MATEQQKINAWIKASIDSRYDSAHVRIDDYGSYMVWKDYGKTTKYGWEIDHEFPKNGFLSLSKVPENQRALNWVNNRLKSDKIDPTSLRKL